MPRVSPSLPARRERRRRGSISAEEIVAGAFEVARAVSLDKLSMPTLAEHLGVGATSIYWYFRKKEDLLNAMTDVAVDRYVAATPTPGAGQLWQQVLREHFRAQRQIHQQDEILSDLLMIRTSTYSRDATRRVFEQLEHLVAVLVDQGFTPENALQVTNTVSVYTRGIIIHDRILRLANAPTLDDRQRRMTDWTTMPILATLVDRYSFSGTLDEDFEFGIDRLICGFDRFLSDQRAEEAGRAAPKRRTKPLPARDPDRSGSPAKKRRPDRQQAS